MKTAIVKTEVKFVMDLLTDLRNGRLRVPKFQRPFVWNQEKMRRLLDSIDSGYPIGSIFVWETSKRYENLAKVGPVAVELDQPEEPASVGYLLDGHQRLSTLMGTLAASEEELAHSDDKFRAYFNLRDEQFEHTRQPRIHHFPLWRLMDTNEFLDQCDRIREEAPESSAAWIKRAKELVNVFQKCAVGLTTVFHTEMSEAIEAFTRLNTEGVRMTPEQIFFALSYREGDINVSAEIDQLVEEVLTPGNYGDISRTALLRVLLAAMNRDIYSSAVDWRALVRDAPEALRSALDECRTSLTAAMAALHELGASSQRVLPYALQLVLFCEFFRAAGAAPTRERIEVLHRWFWVSAFSGAFMVGSSARFNEAVDAARSLAHGEAVDELLDLSAPALPLPKRFHQRAARVRAFFLFLKSLEPLDPNSLEPVRGVLDAGFRDARQVFRKGGESLTRDLANRVLLGAGFSGNAADAFRKLSERTEEERTRVLQSHGISSSAWDALLEGDDERFIKERRAYLVKAELVFMEQHGVTVPRGAEQASQEDEDGSDELVDDADI